MRALCLLTGFLLLLVFQPARAGHSPPKIVLSVHVQTTGGGQSPMEAMSIALPPNNEQIQIRTLPEATEHDLIDAQQDASGLHLQFNHVAQVNLSAVTAQNQGRILVVILDGFVIYAPIIDVQIINGELDIPHPLNPQIVALLQEQARLNVKQAAKS